MHLFVVSPPKNHTTLASHQKFCVGAFLSAQHPQEKLQSMRIIELEREYYNDSSFWLRTFYIFCLTLFKTLKNIVKYSLHLIFEFWYMVVHIEGLKWKSWKKNHFNHCICSSLWYHTRLNDDILSNLKMVFFEESH